MKLIFTLLGLFLNLTFSLTSGQSDSICPPPEVLSPCTCDASKLSIECRQVRGRFNLKSIFDSAATHVNTSATIYNSLDLFDLPLVEIQDDAVALFKFEVIDISSNQNLVYISPRAFPASAHVTRELSLWSNRIDNLEPYARDIYDFISGFPNLETVWIPSNSLTLVPSGAFEGLQRLEEIYLGSNSITSIGSGAFRNTPNLKKLWLSHNSVGRASGGLLRDTFEGIGQGVSVDLTYNGMTFVDQDIFQTLLDRSGGVQVGGSSCGRNGCSYQYLECDQRADWICDKQEEYKDKLQGFRCYGDFNDVWEYCDARRNI